jgi:16S rRNA (uracil1498-N3)-methyltransferase
MQLFYFPDISGNNCTLSEEESKHAVRVLRLKEKDIIYLVDGKGGFYSAEIEDDNVKRCRINILEKKEEYGRRGFFLHLAVAPTKNIERFEWFLEKATELGIDEITPLECQHSERAVVKHERLNKVIISAMKQSVKAYLPKLNELARFKDFLKGCVIFKGKKFIAHCMEGEKPSLKNVYSANENVIILIGPEGDFSPEELELATKAGFIGVSLGNSRLRTETAAVAACHALNFLNEK